MIFITGGEAVVYYLHQDKTDSFMDLFYGIPQQKNNWHLSNYPALSMLPYKFYYSLISKDFWNAAISDRENAIMLRQSILGQAILFFNFVCFFVPFILCSNSFLKKNNIDSRLLIVSLIFSGPLLFSMERANFILFSFLFALLFYFYKDSQNKILREFALFCLAVSVNLKLYPVLFGLFLLKEKRWKDTGKCFLYFLFLFFIPMLFFPAKFGETYFLIKGVLRFGGLAQIDGTFHDLFSKYCYNKIVSISSNDFLYNLKQLAGYRGNSGTGLVLSFQNINNLILTNLAKSYYGHIIELILSKFKLVNFIILLTLLLCMCVFLYSKKTWQNYSALVIAMCFLTGEAASVYIVLFMCIPLFEYFISDEDSAFVTIFFSLIFSFVTIPLKLPAHIYFLTPSFFILLVSLIVISIYIVVDTFKGIPFIVKNIKAICAILGVASALCFVLLSVYLVKSSFLNGTIVRPIKISSVEDLRWLTNKVNNGESFDGYYIVQTDDIDLGEMEWMPIGYFGSGKYFSGIYDGKGHVIKNLKIHGDTSSEVGNVGLFGYLKGEVKNLGIESGEISGACVGAFASHGSDNAKIVNCYNKASVNGYRAGGICDHFGGKVIDCTNYGTINGKENGPVISYSAGYAKRIIPDELPETFYGKYEE